MSDRFVTKNEFDTYVKNHGGVSWRDNIAAEPELTQLFTLLLDTPASYAAAADKFVQVNAGGIALEFNLVTAEDVQPGTFPVGDFKFLGDIWLSRDADKLRLGAVNTDYTIEWDGNDAVHTVAAGDFVFLGGMLGVGLIPAQKFEIGSTDNSNRISIYHDNTNMFTKWDDGFHILQTDEGTHTDTEVHIKPKGTASSFLKLYDRDTTTYLMLEQGPGWSAIKSATNDDLHLNPNISREIWCFPGTTGNPDFRVYGNITAEGSYLYGALIMDDVNDEFLIQAENNANHEGITIDLPEANQMFRVRGGLGSYFINKVGIGTVPAWDLHIYNATGAYAVVDAPVNQEVGLGWFKAGAAKWQALVEASNNDLKFYEGVAGCKVRFESGGKVYLADGTGINEFSTDGTMAGDSDDAVPTEKAVRKYTFVMAAVMGTL